MKRTDPAAPASAGMIAHVAPTLSRESGGLASAIRRLVESLHAANGPLKPYVFSAPPVPPEWSGIPCRVFETQGPRRVGWMPALGRGLQQAAPRLIHVHGLWAGHAFAAYGAARRGGIPLVVSPHGMLEPWALRQKVLQKRIAMSVFQRAMLRTAKCLVATSRQEAENMRRHAGGQTPVATIPSGVDLPLPGFEAFGPIRHGAADTRRTALFLSRLHAGKGLPELVSAWAAVASAGWRLRIVGPDTGNLRPILEARIRELGIVDSVAIEGPLWDDAKARALAEADLFVLPSVSENFGMVIAEALAAGLPVITTTGTPWGEIASENCGWWIAPDETALAAALREATALPVETLAVMGARGRQLVQRRYVWKSVASDTLALYRWLLGLDSDRPSRLFLDDPVVVSRNSTLQ